eukprot:CAMPEP_0175812038 /NCGR_PEP_ID=MMETSP0107_2-20121207/4163_1 /TAXON_ID=195067 ORGANISM="Goniomonas pacifica, Strain CCMP1869" /NCGR_SAMPLE_ID=MMETSP0107_2 /ASSEMBLY_ACC=CAM_ASM_000203 /LENGTH=134 /DNA_ID=CAMNT_0017123873 /DNA_START=9 /DNA_END=413 /DNA_ORIENTATION=-
MRAVGQNLTEAELNDLMDELDQAGTIGLPAFLGLMARCHSREEVQDYDLLRALRRHAKDGMLSRDTYTEALREVAPLWDRAPAKMPEFMQELALELDLSVPKSVEDIYRILTLSTPQDDDDVLTKSALQGRSAT